MLSAVTNGLTTVLGWVGTVLSDILTAASGSTAGGALNALLPLFAIGISISVVFLAIKVIKRVVWGA